MLVDLDQDQPRTYVARGNPKLELIACLGGGVLFLLVIVFMMVALFNSPATGPSSRQPGIIGGLSVIPIMLIARGLFAMRNVVRVTLDANGIAVESPISFKHIPWIQIQRIQKKDRSSFMGESHETLVILGTNGKELAQLRDTLDRFHDLVQQLETRSSLANRPPVTDAAEDVAADMIKARRRAKWVGVLCALLTLGMGAGTVFSFREMMQERKFARESVPAQAKIIKHYMVRVTPWLDYEFTDPAGQTHHKSSMVDQTEWDKLARAKTVPIVYVRSDPSLFRLAQGEEKPSFTWFWVLALAACLFFAFGTVMTFLGYDLKTKGGVFQVTRWGQPLDD